MATLVITLPGHRPYPVGDAQPLLTFGRASGNTVVIDDPSISRFHARLRWERDRAILEDLESRNGSLLNGAPVRGPEAVRPGDVITLGRVDLRVEDRSAPLARVEEPRQEARNVTFAMSVDKLRRLEEGPGSGEARRLRQALDLIHDQSLLLLSETSAEAMLEDLLERLTTFLKPGRAAVLLQGAGGQLEQVAARTPTGPSQEPIRLSRTLVDAAVHRREAMLMNDPLMDPRLGQAASIVLSNITSIMTVPLEHEGEVAGLLYFDAGPSRESFTEEDLRLTASLGHLAAAKLQHGRMAAEVRKKRDLEREMAIARQIQERLLPSRLPEVTGYELLGENISCLHVSGDLYGFWPRPDGRFWLAIADVAGKGVGPGLLMATFQAYMEAWSGSDLGPADLAARISATLGRNTQSNRYITAFLARLDPGTHTLEYTNAGHNPALLLRQHGEVERLESQGLPLAMFPGSHYRQGEVRLEPSDLLCLYTDGITEAAGPEGTDFDLGGLEALLGAHRDAPLPDLNRALQAALDQHTQGSPMTDDRTLVILRRSQA